MSDTGRTDPFENVFSLAAVPIAAVIRSFDQMRKGADELMRGMENFNATMENLNETAARVNRLMNDFEGPLRAMLPQMTRTVKLAEEFSNRLAAPIDQVAPGLSRLADMLDSPIFSAMPRDLGRFMEIINDVGRRMSPLAQLAEQAGSMFGLMRLPGLSSRASTAPDATDGAPDIAAAKAAAPRPAARARKEAAPPRTGKRTVAKKAAPTGTKRAATKQSAAKRTSR
jgi:hypothetical protein